jgi:CBS domain-containing protein
MEPAHLLRMLERIKLGYYAQGEVIVSPEQGAVDRFLVIKQGMVHGEQNVANIAGLRDLEKRSAGWAA